MNKSPLVEKEETFSSCGLLTLKLLPLELIAIQQEIADLRQHDPLTKMKKAELIELARKLRRDETHWRRRCLDKEDLLSRRERASEALSEELAREQGDREDAEAELSSVKADYEKDMEEYRKFRQSTHSTRVELEREREDRENCEAELEDLKAKLKAQTNHTCKMRSQKQALRAEFKKEQEKGGMAAEMAVRCEQQQDFIDAMVGYQSFEEWVSLQQKEEEDCESDESSD